MDYEGFKGLIYKMSHIDLSSYKERQMKRRIDSLIKRNGYEGYEDYVRALRLDKELYDEFINYLTINVSEFYRNQSQWLVLEKEIIPMLLKNNSKIKIWSAACSTGEEPYSLVMLMTKFMGLKDIKIIASDIDDGALAKAKKGCYAEKSLVNLPTEFVSKYFDKDKDSFYIKSDIKNQVEFIKHNLLEDDYPKNCDLIVCRNVMIYFTEEAKATIYKKFKDSLNRWGVLFVGSTEQIILPNRYGLAAERTFFYKRDDSVSK